MKRGPILFIVFFILIWLPIFLMWSAHAASVGTNTRAVNPFGITLVTGLNGKAISTVTPLNNQLFNSITELATQGEIDFNTGGWEKQQKTYLFNIQGFGNGTTTLKFIMGAIPTNILSPGSASQTLAQGPVVLTITYTENALNVLEIDFIGTASSGLANGVVNGSSWFPVIFTFSAILMVFSTVDGVVAPLAGRKPRFIPPQYAAPFLVVSIMIFVSTLIIGAIFAGVLKGTIAG